MSCVLCAVRMLFNYVSVTNGFPNSDLEIFQSKMLTTPDAKRDLTDENDQLKQIVYQIPQFTSKEIADIVNCKCIENNHFQILKKCVLEYENSSPQLSLIPN